MDNPNSQAMSVVIPAYRMHTQMFNNMLDGIREGDALERIANKTNHFAWMTGNLVNARYWLAGILGLSENDPNEALFKDARALDLSATYPSLAELKKEWHRISPILYQRLLKVTESEINEPYPFGMGVKFLEENKLNMIGMTLDRESYLLGQLGLMRKILGYEGVKYDTDDNLNY